MNTSMSTSNSTTSGCCIVDNINDCTTDYTSDCTSRLQFEYEPASNIDLAIGAANTGMQDESNSYDSINSGQYIESTNTSNYNYIDYRSEYALNNALNNALNKSNNLMSYIGLDKLEKSAIVDVRNIISISRVKKMCIAFKKSFPFLSIEHVNCTRLLHYDVKGKLRDIFALECPSRLAKRLGLHYDKASCQDLVDDDLLEV